MLAIFRCCLLLTGNVRVIPSGVLIVATLERSVIKRRPGSGRARVKSGWWVLSSLTENQRATCGPTASGWPCFVSCARSTELNVAAAANNHPSRYVGRPIIPLRSIRSLLHRPALNNMAMSDLPLPPPPLLSRTPGAHRAPPPSSPAWTTMESNCGMAPSNQMLHTKAETYCASGTNLGKLTSCVCSYVFTCPWTTVILWSRLHAGDGAITKCNIYCRLRPNCLATR